ncbi:hypothetical protein A6R68_09769, partial [Neotoma lepida]
ADLGKTAIDILSRGFGFGLVKLDVKTKSCSGVELSTTSPSNTDTGEVIGTLESKYKWCECEYGLTFIEKWNIDNTLGTETAIEDQTCQCLRLTFDMTFAPNTCGNFACDVDFHFAGPTIHASIMGQTLENQFIRKYVKVLTPVILAWTSGANSTCFGIAAKISWDLPASVAAKVNNSSLIGVGYAQTLRPGVKLTLSALAEL